jgi:hypothetical protein
MLWIRRAMKPLAVIRTDGSTERVRRLDRDLGRIDSLGRPIGGVESDPAPQAFGESDPKDMRGGANQYPAGNLKPNIYYNAQDFTLGLPGFRVVVAVSRADRHPNGTAGEESKPAGSGVNARPGQTETSPAPDRTARAGFSFDEPVAWTVEDAGCDC